MQSVFRLDIQRGHTTLMTDRTHRYSKLKIKRNVNADLLVALQAAVTNRCGPQQNRCVFSNRLSSKRVHPESRRRRGISL